MPPEEPLKASAPMLCTFPHLACPLTLAGLKFTLCHFAYNCNLVSPKPHFYALSDEGNRCDRY